MSNISKFSIVTPSYNQAQYIPKTIESVLSQTGDFEIEYFVMDGGSTDGSVEIIKHYADQVAAGTWPKQCANITLTWVSQKDKGQSDAINQGLHRASGDFCSYINSDDLYPPNTFAQVVKAFKQHPTAHFIYGDGEVIDKNGNLQWEWLSRPYNHRVMTSYHFLWNDFTNYIIQQATFWQRRVADKIGYFDETFHYAMDVEYWIRAGHYGLKLQHIRHKLGQFRLIQGTKSLSSPTIFWEDYLEIYRRYRGERKMAIFFAYYYYNLAIHFDFDMEQAIRQGQRVFTRWQELPAVEQTQIVEQSQRGVALAWLLQANALYDQQRYEQAALSYEQGRKQRQWVILHPFGLEYRLKQLIGTSMASHWNNLREQLIQLYRQKRFDYRYQQTKESSGAT